MEVEHLLAGESVRGTGAGEATRAAGHVARRIAPSGAAVSYTHLVVGATKGKRKSRFDGWTLDRQSHRLTSPEGADVPLTRGEYVMLVALLDAPGRALSREFLLQATRVHEDIYDRSVDVQILRLRRKLEANPNSPRVIKTERGLGYVLSVPVESDD